VAERLRRYVQVVVNFVGVGSSPTECNTFFVFFVGPPATLYRTRWWLCGLHPRHCSGGQGDAPNIHWSLDDTLQTHARGEGTHQKLSRQRLPRPKPTKKGYGGTGIRARVKRITTAYANHYTIPPLVGYKWYT
jgi:hypothetical protein